MLINVRVHAYIFYNVAQDLQQFCSHGGFKVLRRLHSRKTLFHNALNMSFLFTSPHLLLVDGRYVCVFINVHLLSPSYTLYCKRGIEEKLGELLKQKIDKLEGVHL